MISAMVDGLSTGAVIFVDVRWPNATQIHFCWPHTVRAGVSQLNLQPRQPQGQQLPVTVMISLVKAYV